MSFSHTLIVKPPLDSFLITGENKTLAANKGNTQSYNSAVPIVYFFYK